MKEVDSAQALAITPEREESINRALDEAKSKLQTLENQKKEVRGKNFTMGFLIQTIFSSPELKAQVSFSDHLSSVVCLSVRPSVRPSVCL